MPRTIAVPRELTTAPFTGTAAVAAGLLTRRQLQGDTWCRLLPDVYVWSGLALDHRTRCRAAGLWGAGVLVRDGPVEVTVPLSTRLRAPDGLAIVRSPLPPYDVTERAGVSLTSAERTAFDLGRRLPVVEAVVAVDAMLAAKLITKSGLAAFATDRPGWPGIDQLTTVLLVSDAGAASPQESRLRVLLLGSGLPRPVTRATITGAAASSSATSDG
jgi:hypothetical protein